MQTLILTAIGAGSLGQQLAGLAAMLAATMLILLLGRLASVGRAGTLMQGAMRSGRPLPAPAAAVCTFMPSAVIGAATA